MSPRPARLVVGAGLAWLGAVALSRALVVVEGWSMAPTLAPGDRLLALPLPRGLASARGTLVDALVDALVRPDAVVVVAEPDATEDAGQEHRSVKRVRDVGPDGVWVEGDHPTRSTDSRTYGALPRERVHAVVVAHWPALWRRP